MFDFHNFVFCILILILEIHVLFSYFTHSEIKDTAYNAINILCCLKYTQIVLFTRRKICAGNIFMLLARSTLDFVVLRTLLTRRALAVAEWWAPA